MSEEELKTFTEQVEALLKENAELKEQCTYLEKERRIWEDKYFKEAEHRHGRRLIREE